MLLHLLTTLQIFDCTSCIDLETGAVVNAMIGGRHRLHPMYSEKRVNIPEKASKLGSHFHHETQ